MQREIRFRAWDGNQMYYTNEEQTVWMGGIEVSVNSNKGKIVRDFIGMQFTGLKDKNGKDIYEGDNVHIKGGEEFHGMREFDKIGIVQFAHGSFCPVCEDVWYDFGNIAQEDIEVIGNIYENPELLKSK